MLCSTCTGKAATGVKIAALVVLVALHAVLYVAVVAARNAWHGNALAACRTVMSNEIWIIDEYHNCVDPTNYHAEYAVADLIQGVRECGCTAVDVSHHNLTVLLGVAWTQLPYLETLNASYNTLTAVPGADAWPSSFHTLELAGNPDPRLMEDPGLHSLLGQIPANSFDRHPGVVEVLLDSEQVMRLLRSPPPGLAIRTIGIRLDTHHPTFPNATLFNRVV